MMQPQRCRSATAPKLGWRRAGYLPRHRRSGTVRCIAAAHPTQVGFWRVGFLGEPDHPGIPDKHITVREGEEEDE